MQKQIGNEVFVNGSKRDDTALYRDLVELNEAGLFILENDIIVYANPAFCLVLEKDKNEVMGESIFHFVHEKDHMELNRQVGQLLSGKINLVSDNFRVKRKEKEDKYFSLHLKVNSKKDGISIIHGASRNSTARVVAQKELERTKSKFEVMYRNMLDGIFIYNYLTEKTIDCNDSARRILGFENKAEMLKLNRFDYIPKSSPFFPGLDLHALTIEHGEMVFKGKSFFTRGVFNAKGGKQILANVNVVPTFDVEGEAYVIFHDTTDMVTQRKELKASEQRYRDVFENSHEAITLLDIKSGKMIDCNSNALELYGVKSKDELFNLPRPKFHENFFKKYKNANKYILDKIKEAREHGRAYATFEAIKKTGEEFIYEGVFVLDDTDKVNPKILTFARDVQDRFNAEKEKNKLIAELVEAKKEIDEQNEKLQKYIESNLQLENFAYFASHDLRTPLRSIISFTQLLNKSMSEKMSVIEKEYMQFIVDSGNNMQRLIEDLLSFSRINAESIKLENINTGELIEEVEKELFSVIKAKKAKICKEDLPENFVADKTKIKQLFSNLISNGLKFVGKDKVPEIKIAGKGAKKYWQFAISDNGIGIDGAYKEKIFLMFKRLHNSTEYEGTGIGLAMCRKIVEQHEGEIWVESELGQGTCFYFKIKKGL